MLLCMQMQAMVSDISGGQLASCIACVGKRTVLMPPFLHESYVMLRLGVALVAVMVGVESILVLQEAIYRSTVYPCSI